MENYKSALKAMHLLLIKTGVEGWAKWIEKDIALAEENIVEHHLRAYGGMGSLNDVVICTANNHKVTKEHEPWMNYLFQNLKGLCYTMASKLSDDINISVIEKALWKESEEIQGWRCLECGYGRLFKSDIENFIAPKLLKSMMVNAINNQELLECVEQVLALDIPHRKKEYLKTKEIALNSGLYIDENYSGWMRPCPNCNGSDTVVYRWKVSKDLFSEEKFIPSENNLSMKNKKF